MSTPTDTPYQVVEMERTRGQGPGEVILFGLLAPTTTPPTTHETTQPSTTQTPTPIFCLCFRKTGWDFIMDGHYKAETIHKVASNGAQMGLRDLIRLAKAHASAKYPNG
ncbi:MAG: hypothetical protein AAB391_00290 [Patescibacteria group bacterium]